MAVLLSIGIEEAHISTVTKQIDDILESKKHGGDGDGDSSIEEPDVRAEAAHLDEFEALFRVAPVPAVTAKNEDKSASAMTDFKIQRK